MLLSLDPDILLAVETKLDGSVQSSEFLPPHFIPSRHDRKRDGGGVLIATRDNIIAEPLLEFDTDCELRWVKIHLDAAKTLIVGVFYRPPDSSTQCLHALNTSINNVRAKFPEAILMLGGDFNLPGTDWSSLTHIPSKSGKTDCEFLQGYCST